MSPFQGRSHRFPKGAQLPSHLSMVQTVMSLIKSPSLKLLCYNSAVAEGFSCQLSASGSIVVGNFTQHFPKCGKIALCLLFALS